MNRGDMNLPAIDVLVDTIRTLCEQQEISINKLAALSGLAQSTVDSILKGKSKNPTMKTIDKLARGFGMSSEDFASYVRSRESLVSGVEFPEIKISAPRHDTGKAKSMAGEVDGVMDETGNETRDAELETLFTEVARRKEEMDRARMVWREAADRVAAALNKRIGHIDQNTTANHALDQIGQDTDVIEAEHDELAVLTALGQHWWLAEIEARHAHATRDITRLLAALRTALEGLDEIGQGTADAHGYDHVLARIARDTLAAIETIGEGEDGA